MPGWGTERQALGGLRGAQAVGEDFEEAGGAVRGGGGGVGGGEQALQEGEQVLDGHSGADGAGGLGAGEQGADRTPLEVAEEVRRMVAGEGGPFADLFAEDGVLEYPFALPGQPRELRGREAIRAYHGGAAGSRRLFDMDGVEAVVRVTDDPEVVVAQIEHHGRSVVTGEAYRFRALGVMRVREGQIVSYEDCMDPIATARLLGRTADLAAALSG